jgi:outer membrane lipoprotein-sorting protein
MNRQWLIVLSVVVALSLLVGGCESRPTAEEIVAQMKEVEASVEDAHALVAFSVQAQEMAMDSTVEVWEKRPNKFRAEVLEASEDDLVGIVSVTDGQQVWMYHPGENEVVVGGVGELGMDEEAFLNPRQAFEFMEEAIQWVLDTCDVELVGEEELDGVAVYKLEFTPKEGEESPLPIPMEGKITLWVEQERWIALQAHFDGGTLGEGWMRVRSFEFNVGLSDDRFQFTIPAGARVIKAEDVGPTPLTLDEARDQADFPLLVPAYLPEGVTLIDVFGVHGAFVLYYDHAETSFTVMQGSPEATGEIPVGQETAVTVRGQTATLVTNDLGNSFLTWTEDGVAITIAGRVSEDEILKVAESLQ